MPDLTMPPIREISVTMTMTTSGRHAATITGTAVRAIATIVMTTMDAMIIIAAMSALLTVGNLSGKRLVSVSGRVRFLKSRLISIKSLPVRR